MDRQRKRELRDLNARAWAGEGGVFPTQGSLDSTLKKNTGFIKRLRTAISDTNTAAFLQEIRTLSLQKYLSEIISACYEGLCRLKTPAEISAGVEIVSALHQRFGPSEFTGYLGWYVGRGLSTPDKVQLKSLPQDVRDKEEKERISRQRVLLRVATELWLVGVLRSLEDVVRPEEASKAKDGSKTGDINGKVKTRNTDVDAEPFPLEVLKDMLGHDREHVNLPLVVLFVKTFGWDILGANVSGDSRKVVQEDGATPPKPEDSTNDEDPDVTNDPPLVQPELRQRFKNILTRYFEDVKAHLVRDQKTLAAQQRRNAEAYVKSGEVFEDREAKYEKQVKSQEKLVANTQVLADALHVDMPDLKEKDASGAAGDGSIGLVKTEEYLRGQSEGAGIWEDEDERRFYENLLDPKDRVPGILLEDGKNRKTEADEADGKKSDAQPDDSTKADEVAAPADAKTEGDDQSIAIANKSIGAQVNALLARLPELTNKDQVDQMALDFCFLNSKASRNRLIKALQDIPKGRADLLPLYSRLIATLGKYMPDVSQGLVNYLDEEFRSLQRRKTKEFLGQVRTVNIRYLAELTKFGVVPEHIIFHCLKVSLDDFSRMNIDIISNLLENCGRYLLRNPETSPRMNSFLETLQRKKTAQHLGQQERLLIENAMYYVNPPERAAIQQKERTPTDLFIRKLIYIDLHRPTLEKIVKQIRKLHWEEPEVVGIVHKIFTKPHKIKYTNVRYLAEMLELLNRYHKDFVVSVIDDVIESIAFHLELNDFKFNQRRIAEVKYLGELYLHRLVDSPTIFDMLPKILLFGYEGGIPRPGVVNPLDLPDDFFRVRLVCKILETCGQCFSRGQTKEKLDYFLALFQYYIQTKDSLPMEMEFLIDDTFGFVRPQWKRVTDLEESWNAFLEAWKKQAPAMDKAADVEEPDDRSEADEGVDDEDEAVRNEVDENGSGESAEATGDEEEPAGESSDTEDEQIVVTMQKEERDPEADAEFDRELAKLMSESLDARKADRKPVFDLPLPLRRGAREAVVTEDNGSESPAPVMKFALLSKRGNKAQTRAIDLPADSTFAVAMRNQQQAEREEQQRIKNLVLNYDLRDEAEPDGIFPSLSFLPPNPNRKPKQLASSQGVAPAPQSAQLNPTEPSEVALDKHHNPYIQPRLDKAGNNRSNQRARKLQLSDVDWYSSSTDPPTSADNKDPQAMRQERREDRRDSLGSPLEEFIHRQRHPSDEGHQQQQQQRGGRGGGRRGRGGVRRSYNRTIG